MRALLELGADLNETEDNGGRPLYMAAQNGHEAVARVLIEAGVDINEAKDSGVTPLFSPLNLATRRWCG